MVKRIVVQTGSQMVRRMRRRAVPSGIRRAADAGGSVSGAAQHNAEGAHKNVHIGF